MFANSFVPTSIIRSFGFFNNWSRFSTIALHVPPGKFSTILNTCWLFFLICHSTWSPQWLQPSYCFFDLMACFYLHSQYLCCLLFVFQFYCGYYWVLGNPSLLFLKFQNFYFLWFKRKFITAFFWPIAFLKLYFSKHLKRLTEMLTVTHTLLQLHEIL